MTSLSRPRLKPTIEAFDAPDGDLYLLRDATDDVVIRSPDAAARALVAQLDGRRRPDQIAAALRAQGHAIEPADVEATIAQLAAEGLLEDAAEDEQLDLAAAAEGLDDEVALLRVLVRRELRERPEDLRLALQGLTLLVRAVAARYHLSPADQEALERRIVEAVRMITASVDQEVIDV